MSNDIPQRIHELRSICERGVPRSQALSASRLGRVVTLLPGVLDLVEALQIDVEDLRERLGERNGELAALEDRLAEFGPKDGIMIGDPR